MSEMSELNRLWSCYAENRNTDEHEYAFVTATTKDEAWEKAQEMYEPGWEVEVYGGEEGDE